MKEKEANARIKINKLLEMAGWRFFPDNRKKANICLELNVKISERDLNELGEDFEHSRSGFVDYLLLDERNNPLVVLEAKRDKKDPLDGKEQARRYAQSLDVRFIILSNGNIHYFWDLAKGNPFVIPRFPSPESFKHLQRYKPDPAKLVSEKVTATYILESQCSQYEIDPDWLDESKRSTFLQKNNYRLLRDYQLNAVHSIQKAVEQGNDRFLFEMATGTGKTLTAAAVIKLFMKTGNASRVLFLVDRLELEDQAKKAFIEYLSSDYTTVVFKENRDDWNRAKVVVSTVQSLTNKYMELFSPTDYDLIISDEAHRSINGNARALFEYFGGYKLGLTATPKDYLKHLDVASVREEDPRNYERRILLDTYKTFGCESSDPTFQYTLLDGVKDGYLLNPVVIDARTDVTTQLLSDEGYSALVTDEDGNMVEKFFSQRDFEKKFFSDPSNRVFCQAFLDRAQRDPVSGEIGKSIVFCVSQNHAAKITKLLNEIADRMFPGRYNSDFAIQVTSRIPDSQRMTINFRNNNLNGKTRFLEGYKSSKTRVCVTVGMMTTGYDCTDILNLVLMRPIFSPSDFIQIKGRGTRKHMFAFTKYESGTQEEITVPKENFLLFDFFANCEYFEEMFNYDEVIDLPPTSEGEGPHPPTPPQPKPDDAYDHTDPDQISTLEETPIGLQGMKIDRKMFERFAEQVKQDEFIREKVEEEDFTAAEDYIINEIFHKPEDYLDLDKLRKALRMDWRLPFRQILEYIFGHVKRLKSKHEALDDEFDKFLAIHHPDSKYVPVAKRFFKAYVTDEQIRSIINAKEYAQLATNEKITLQDMKDLNGWRDVIPGYVKDYVPLNPYMN